MLTTEEVKELIEVNIDVYFSEYGEAWNDTNILVDDESVALRCIVIYWNSFYF